MLEVMGISNVTIETGCLNAVTLVFEVLIDPPWWNQVEVRICRKYMTLHPNVMVKIIGRQENEVAHQIA